MESLGITGIHSLHFATHSLTDAKALFEGKMGFTPVFRASEQLSARTGQRSIVYAAGQGRFCVSEPVSETCRAARYLKLHPSGVMSVSFNVKDVGQVFSEIEKRGGTPLAEIFAVPGYRDFEIATPLGDVQFRFIEQAGDDFAPGFDRVPSAVNGPIAWQMLDHFTVNMRTMKPFIDWCASVLGFEQFWEIQFHTTDLEEGKKKDTGSGLKSIVMWDPHSGVKIATNEPLRPFFRTSQIEKFVQDNRGPGVQHIAIEVPSIIDAVDGLNANGLKFLPAPAEYYARLPKRFAEVGLDMARIKEPIAGLQKRSILADGSRDGYMLQIFTDELGVLGKEPDPAFFEVIQRAGDKGFGYGNFRALFEAIEGIQAKR